MRLRRGGGWGADWEDRAVAIFRHWASTTWDSIEGGEFWMEAVMALEQRGGRQERVSGGMSEDSIERTPERANRRGAFGGR